MASSPPFLPPRLVPRWLAWTVVALSLTLAAALMPSRRQLVGRLLEDGESQRAMEVARSPEETNSSFLPAVAPGPMDRLRASLTPDFPGRGAVAAMAIESAADPVACLELLHRMEANLAPKEKRPLYLAIIRSALAQNQPALAAEMAEDAVRHGLTDAAIRLTAVKAWRWAVQPERALEVFQAWRAADPATFTPAAEDIEIALCRELNRNDHALALLRARLKEAPQISAVSGETMELILSVAANAGRSAEVLPDLTAWLQAQPGGVATWEQLASGSVKPGASFLRCAGLLARHSEWTGAPDTALDWYLKLAVLGDGFARERASELQKGLNRSSDWMQLLQRIVPVPGQEKYTRQLARLLGEAGLYDEAPPVYQLWFKDHPGDIPALMELAALYSEMPEPQQALALYEKVTVLAPDNLEARKEIADLRLVLKDFPGAFRYYMSLPESAHDATSLENFSLLAESLGDYPAYNRSLVMRYHRLQNPASTDYLELARSYELINRPDGAISTLTEGLRRVPQSRVLRTHLAQAWRNRGNFDEAILLLAVPALKTDMLAMSLFIEVCCLKEDYQRAFAFLGRGIEKKFGFPPDVRLDLGHIYFNNGYMTEADTLYSSVPDEPSLWPLIANAKFRRGELEGAEAYQRKYLAFIRVPDAPGWLLMGDILRARGRETDAQAAYQRSLQLMEQKLSLPPVASGSAAQTPRPVTASAQP